MRVDGVPESRAHEQQEEETEPHGEVHPGLVQHAPEPELMPARVSKASALKVMAARLGLEAGEVIAFGDGENDVSMFEWAGTSVAMPHGWPAAIAAATYTAPEGADATAFARGVDMLFDE